MKKSIILGVILSVLSLCVYGEEEVKKRFQLDAGGNGCAESVPNQSEQLGRRR